MDYRKEYDALLEKSQNDLIKIRLREKSLNDALVAAQRDSLLLEEQLRAEILSLKGKLSEHKADAATLSLHNGKLQEEISHLNSELKEWMSKYDMLLEKRVETELTPLVDDSRQEIQQINRKNVVLQQRIELLEQSNQEYKSLKAQNDHLRSRQNEAQLRLQLQSAEMEQLCKATSLLREQCSQLVRKDSQSKSRMQGLNSTIEKQQKILEQRETEVWALVDADKRNKIVISLKDEQRISLQLQVDSLKRDQVLRLKRTPEIKDCMKCKEFEQELQLQKQIARSANLMLQAKKYA